jgi:hypothetical protein
MKKVKSFPPRAGSPEAKKIKVESFPRTIHYSLFTVSLPEALC